MQTQKIGQSAGDVTGVDAGRVIRVDSVGAQVRVVRPVYTGEDAGPRSVQRIRWDARVFQRFPAHLQEQALLRVHPRGFARRNAEEASVKAVHLVEKTATDRHSRGWTVNTR